MSPREPFTLNHTQFVAITAWADYEAAIRDAGLHGWAFRGQSSAAWPVESALTRRFIRYGVHPSAWPLQERRILSLFKRKAHLFLEHIPDETDYFQWLGLMQHHGAPTRLLDFTWSPEVAAFFALESATPGTHCSVWALCVPKLWNASFRIGDRELNASALSLRQPANYETHYLPNAFPFVSTDDPFVMNQRIIAQSGTFVVPGTLTQPVEQILSDLGGSRPAEWIKKFELDVDSVRPTGMSALYRMNVSNATLFPGLDGMARSLAFESETHWAYNPKTFHPIQGYEAEFDRLRNQRLDA
jgi:hypothetical protein